MPAVENPERFHAARAVSLAAVFWCAAMLTGCQSTGQGNAWQPTADAEAQIKDPERLRLSFAQMSEQRGDYNAAREAYQQVSSANPQSPEAILGLARLDLLAGRIQAAERQFLQAYQVAPENSLVIESLGQFYLTQERYDEAVRHLSRGIELTPGNNRMRHRLAVALAKQGNIAAAEPHFAQSVGDAEADYNIGLILYEQGQIKEAEERFLSAVLKKPTLVQAQNWLDAVRQETQSANQTQLASASQAPNDKQPVQQATSQTPSSPPPARNADAGPRAESRTSAETPPHASQPGGANQASVPSLPQSQAPASSRTLRPTESRPASPGLDLSLLNATQLEQLENSLTPTERARFHQCLRTGTPFSR